MESLPIPQFHGDNLINLINAPPHYLFHQSIGSCLASYLFSPVSGHLIRSDEQKTIHRIFLPIATAHGRRNFSLSRSTHDSGWHNPFFQHSAAGRTDSAASISTASSSFYSPIWPYGTRRSAYWLWPIIRSSRTTTANTPQNATSWLRVAEYEYRLVS